MAQTLERRVTIVTAAIATLIYQDQDKTYLEHGISFDALVSAATAQGTKYSKRQLEANVNKAISSGSLIKLKNGNLALGSWDHGGDSFKFEYSADFSTKEMTSSANSTCRSSPQMSVLVGKRRKMAKKVFDPSDHQMGRKKPAINVPINQKKGHPAGTLNKRTIKRLRRKMVKMGFDLSDNNVPSKQKKGRPEGSLNKRTIQKRRMYAGLQKYNLQLPKKGAVVVERPASNEEGFSQQLLETSSTVEQHLKEGFSQQLLETSSTVEQHLKEGFSQQMLETSSTVEQHLKEGFSQQLLETSSTVEQHLKEGFSQQMLETSSTVEQHLKEGFSQQLLETSSTVEQHLKEGFSQQLLETSSTVEQNLKEGFSQQLLESSSTVEQHLKEGFSQQMLETSSTVEQHLKEGFSQQLLETSSTVEQHLKEGFSQQLLETSSTVEQHLLHPHTSNSCDMLQS